MKNLTPKKTAGWTNVQVYTAIAVVLVVGGIGGYLLHSSATPSESFQRGLLLARQPQPAAFDYRRTAADAGCPDQAAAAALDANPKDVSALTELGNIYFDASQWTTAIGYYTRALNETPKNPDVRTDMGIAYYYTGDAIAPSRNLTRR